MAYMTRKDWEEFIAKKAFSGTTKEKQMVDHLIEYETQDGQFFHNCKLLVPFTAWHHGYLERFPYFHKFVTVAFDNQTISFFDAKGLVSRHKVGLHIGPQVPNSERDGTPETC